MKTQESNKSRLRAALFAFACAGLVAASFFAIRRTGWFSDYVEVPLYDTLTISTWPWKTGHPEVALVTIRDHTSWPLSDAALANSLNSILRGGASFIGVDLKRDALRPDQNGSAAIFQLAETHYNVIWVRGLSGPGSFDPPPFLKLLQSQGKLDAAEMAFRCPIADFPSDARRVVRRAYVSAGGSMSLAAVLAQAQASNRYPDRRDEFRDRMDEIGSLPGNAGGYQLKGLGGFNDIGGQFLLKSGPDLDALFPDVSLADAVAKRPTPAAEDSRNAAMATYALEDLPAMNDETLRHCFSGKLVFLGTHDPGTAEDEKAVIGHEKLRGIRLHALAAAQLLRELIDGEPPVRFAKDWTEDIAVVLAAFLAVACVWFVRLPPVWKSVLFPFGLPTAIFGGSLAAMDGGLWLPPGAAMVSAFVAASASLAILLRVESRERSSIYQVFERHVGQEIARRVWSHNDQLLRDGTIPSESFTATALFSDLRGYSSISESFHQSKRMDDFSGWLQRYLHTMDATVQEHRGFIKQFAGDGIFVMFGFPPRGNDDHAQQAVRCAIAMEAAIRHLNANLAPGFPPYHVRIGIYTGPVHATSVGGSGQFDYAFLGPTINKASRLEGLRKASFDPSIAPVRILVSDPTRDLLPPAIPLEPFDAEPIGLDAGGDPERVWKISPFP